MYISLHLLIVVTNLSINRGHPSTITTMGNKITYYMYDENGNINTETRYLQLRKTSSSEAVKS